MKSFFYSALDIVFIILYRIQVESVILYPGILVYRVQYSALRLVYVLVLLTAASNTQDILLTPALYM